MLSLKNILPVSVFFPALIFSISAYAGLYGFNPPTEQQQEKPLFQKQDIAPQRISNYHKSMRELVMALSEYGKSRVPGFQIFTHGGQELLEKSLWEYHLENYNNIQKSSKNIPDTTFLAKETEIPEDIDEDMQAQLQKYIANIDGVVVNSHYCGDTRLVKNIKTYNIPAALIEYCPTTEALDNAIEAAFKDHNMLYAFTSKENAFNKIKKQLIINENANNIFSGKEAKNISFLLDTQDYRTPYHVLDDIRNSNYDIIVVNPLFQDNQPYSADDVHAMQFKKNGAQRLVLATLNVSEINKYDEFWQKSWNTQKPDWLLLKTPNEKNTYIAKYWAKEWQRLLSRKFKDLIDRGYNGVLLTGIENLRYFEEQQPLE